MNISKVNWYRATGVLLFTLTTQSVVQAQWLGPWGSGDDLAAAWGLEESPINDPDEGPGETLDFSRSAVDGAEKNFGMSVESGKNVYTKAAPVVVPRRAPTRVQPRPTSRPIYRATPTYRTRAPAPRAPAPRHSSNRRSFPAPLPPLPIMAPMAPMSPYKYMPLPFAQPRKYNY
ncbi:MAG: hypothetical protein HOM84_03685 [Thiotrichales bacterium]|jgi:hypothetical protein|nr:hypothetical protein [Thiotrichales bacterium]MBT3614016.1 hypothetical protein [Thiotrichales bacterium]MBT3752063.1 hypothetical protein [Thiotrichales bacterium]MBT3836777.1 hypothetical protein [Thiotrichales bacterium]MBT4151551.1 hypothetical protein [Thiotrichales bacterium]